MVCVGEGTRGAYCVICWRQQHTRTTPFLGEVGGGVAVGTFHVMQKGWLRPSQGWADTFYAATFTHWLTNGTFAVEVAVWVKRPQQRPAGSACVRHSICMPYTSSLVLYRWLTVCGLAGCGDAWHCYRLQVPAGLSIQPIDMSRCTPCTCQACWATVCIKSHGGEGGPCLLGFW